MRNDPVSALGGDVIDPDDGPVSGWEVPARQPGLVAALPMD